MEPSRQTAGRRQRELRAISRRFEERFGPDEADTVYTFDDGWTIRRLERVVDQRREGELMRSCLRALSELDPNCWSLRDTDNLPHATFSVWTVEPDDDLETVPDEDIAIRGVFYVKARQALFGVSAGRVLKESHKARLREWMEDRDLSLAPPVALDPFPQTRQAQLRSMREAADPVGAITTLSRFPGCLTFARMGGGVAEADGGRF
jgi:hypothetical protein